MECFGAYPQTLVLVRILESNVALDVSSRKVAVVDAIGLGFWDVMSDISGDAKAARWILTERF